MDICLLATGGCGIILLCPLAMVRSYTVDFDSSSDKQGLWVGGYTG